MKRYCERCGSKLEEITKLCPNCDGVKIKPYYKQNRKMERQTKKRKLKAKKKIEKKNKQVNWSALKKNRRFFLKLISIILLLVLLATSVMGTLVYFDIVNIPFLSNFNQNNLLEIVNEKSIKVKEESIDMINETEGVAVIIVTLPNYELLFKNANAAKNSDQYLLMALALKKYETQKFKKSAKVTVENGKKIVHSDEVVHELLEESLIKAINALSEVEQ